MSEIAVGVVMFQRTSKLEKLLESCDELGIETVYVADNGKVDDRKETLYDREFSFDLTVFNLEFNAGVGECRRVLSERPNEEYMLFLDSDMQVPPNYQTLVDQLDRRPSIGGISGSLLELGEHRIRAPASDLFEDGDTLHKDIRENKEIELVAGSPLVTFDFVAQVGLFRRECITDYTWDDFYKIQREHIDFFVGHLRNTSWEFALNPGVYFPHFPGGDEEYVSHRQSDSKIENSHSYFMDKWGYEEVSYNTDVWLDTYNAEKGRLGGPSAVEKLKQKFSDQGTLNASKYAANFTLEKIGLK